MLTQTDIATFDPRYRRFRAELRQSTQIDPAAFANYLLDRMGPLTHAWTALASKGDTDAECQAWLRWQYARSRGLVR
jgi:hypothetical protein